MHSRFSTIHFSTHALLTHISIIYFALSLFSTEIIMHGIWNVISTRCHLLFAVAFSLYLCIYLFRTISTICLNINLLVRLSEVKWLINRCILDPSYWIVCLKKREIDRSICVDKANSIVYCEWRRHAEFISYFCKSIRCALIFYLRTNWEHQTIRTVRS